MFNFECTGDRFVAANRRAHNTESPNCTSQTRNQDFAIALFGCRQRKKRKMSALFQQRGQLRGGLGNPKVVVTPPCNIHIHGGLGYKRGDIKGGGVRYAPPGRRSNVSSIMQVQNYWGVKVLVIWAEVSPALLRATIGAQHHTPGSGPAPWAPGPGPCQRKGTSGGGWR